MLIDLKTYAEFAMQKLLEGTALQAVAANTRQFHRSAMKAKTARQSTALCNAISGDELAQ